MRIGRLLLLAGCLSALAAAPPALADEDGDHAGPGSTGPDLHSQNLKLLSNVPRSAPAVQSDLAFKGKLAFAGNYLGFRVLDISDPESPTVLSDFRCNGAQSDLSVHGNLLFQSVDSPQSDGGCTSTNVNAATAGMFEGIRIFDISNPAGPEHLASISTDCGSHTHTLVPDDANNRALVYVSSYPLGNAAQGPNCVRAEDGGGHGFISIVNVPLSNPAGATVSKYFLEPDTTLATYPLQSTTFTFSACHDISVNTAIKRAAAACMSESQIWDIADPANPRLLSRFDDPAVNPSNIDLWHSATFSWDGRVVAFGDESGGGGAARCTDPEDNQGRIWFVDLASGNLIDNYKIPRSEPGTCTMHNFNFVPLRDGRKVLVASAYTGGTSVVELVGGSAEEVAFYRPQGANTWSSYWYNGFIYANDILRGLDIFLLSDSVRAGARKLPLLNPQTQTTLIP